MYANSTPYKYNIVIFIVFLVILAFAVGFGLHTNKKSAPPITQPTPTSQSCTLEAKICPDGSAVGRIPPTCEFAECPEANNKLSENKCYIGGCSNELCLDKTVVYDVFSTCEYKEEYACLRYSQCEEQSNGNCGWTSTAEYTQCLNDLTK